MTIPEIEARLMGRTPGLLDVQGHYAVLVPLVERAGELHLLFEVRADTLGRQPGETCFPGGRMEPGEGPTECAFRETWEELGIPAGAIRPIARLDDVYHQGNFLMHPILAQVEPRAVEAMSPNPAEVKETFLVPVDFFQDHPPQVYTYPLRPEVGEEFPYDLIGFPQGYPWKGGRTEVPIWSYGGHAVWGLTGRIVRGFLRAMQRNSPPAGR